MLDKDDARIINLSSLAHRNSDFTNDENIKEMFDLKKAEKKYYQSIAGKGKLYGNTKLLMIYFSKFLNKLFEGKYYYIKSAAVHPGGVDTEFMRFVTLKKNVVIKFLFLLVTPLIKFFLKTPIDGAQTQLNLCYMPFSDFVSGAYYADCQIAKVKESVNDMNKVMESMKITIDEIKKRFPETKIFDVLGDIFNKE